MDIEAREDATPATNLDQRSSAHGSSTAQNRDSLGHVNALRQTLIDSAVPPVAPRPDSARQGTLSTVPGDMADLEGDNAPTEQPVHALAEAQQPRTRPHSHDAAFVWPVKRVVYPPGASELEGEVQVLLQNENGPCSLIALANILLLTRRIAFRPDIRYIAYDELAERIANFLLTRLSDSQEETLDLAGALEVLPKMRYGLDVNVRFDSVDSFADDGTGALALFALAGVKLLHGWVADEADPETWGAVVTRTGDYDTAVSKVATADEVAADLVLPPNTPEYQMVFPDSWSDQQKALVKDGIAIRRFLISTASQLTYPGLFALATSALVPGQLAALFRNSHFTVIYRRPSRGGEPLLFHLVTDSALARAQSVVWEGLTDVDGSEAEFYDAHLSPASFDGDFVPPGSPARERRQPQFPSGSEAVQSYDADEILAKQIQQAEYDAQAERREQRRVVEEQRARVAQQQQQPSRIPPSIAPAPAPATASTHLSASHGKHRKSRSDKDKCIIS